MTFAGYSYIKCNYLIKIKALLLRKRALHNLSRNKDLTSAYGPLVVSTACYLIFHSQYKLKITSMLFFITMHSMYTQIPL